MYQVIISKVPINPVGTGGTLTAAEIRDLLETLIAGQRLSADFIDDMPEAIEMEPEDIRDALETLTGDSRLNATAIKGIPAQLTGVQIVALLEALTDTNQLSLAKISDRGKGLIPGVEKALNYRSEGDIYSEEYQLSDMTNIRTHDYYIAKDIDTQTYGISIQNGDWIIALKDAPNFVFTETTEWRIMPFSKVMFFVMPVLQEGQGTNSIEKMTNNCKAEGERSFAIGNNTQARGDDSHSSGAYCKAIRVGEHVEASGCISEIGDSQHSRLSIRKQTTGSSTVLLDSPNKITFVDGKTYSITIDVVCRAQKDENQESVPSTVPPSRNWRFSMLVAMSHDKDDAPLEYDVVSGGTIATIGNCTASCQILTGIPYYGSMNIAITGMANKVLNWHAFIIMNEVMLTDEEK